MSDKCGCGCDNVSSDRATGPFILCDKVQYADESIVSHTIADGDAGTLTIFAFDKGEALSTHSAPFEAIVQVVDGVAEITVGDETHIVATGQMIIMPADVPHAVKAPERFKMLLTMFRT